MIEGNETLSGRMTDAGHELLARVYYADTDFSGAVYHGRYLEFLERGRSDFLRVLGVHHTDLQAGQTGEPLFWVVKRMEIDFVAPARIDDVLTISTRVAETRQGAHPHGAGNSPRRDATDLGDGRGGGDQQRGKAAPLSQGMALLCSLRRGRKPLNSGEMS